jgi:hypothetical protein
MMTENEYNLGSMYFTDSTADKKLIPFNDEISAYA